MMIDEDMERKATARLAKIAGQVRGIEKMIRERRYCVDILTQIEAARSALAGLGKIILGNHIETCVASALQSKGRRDREQKTNELVKIYARLCGGRL